MKSKNTRSKRHQKPEGIAIMFLDADGVDHGPVRMAVAPHEGDLIEASWLNPKALDGHFIVTRVIHCCPVSYLPEPHITLLLRNPEPAEGVLVRDDRSYVRFGLERIYAKLAKWEQRVKAIAR